MKYLYLLSQTDNTGYDTYDSCVVCAESEDRARLIQPGGEIYSEGEPHWYASSWAVPDKVSVTLIGQAADNIELNTVVCASFNAG